jgi:hypothetical protein
MRPFIVTLALVSLLPSADVAGLTKQANRPQLVRPTSSHPLTVVALGDSWREGARCGGCRTYAGLYADGLEAETADP